MSLNSPKVSVAFITYNHENFIAQALDSVLTQKTTFEFEVVIGEDLSPDRTREIAAQYCDRDSHIFRLLPATQNLGGVPNAVRTYQACRGQYIAILEGDDYWTDPQKLQMQADYLDANPECSMCFHRYRTITGNSARQEDETLRPLKSSYVLDDVLNQSGYSLSVGTKIHANTMMIRSSALLPLPDWIHKAPVGDKVLVILAAMKGSIGLIDREMSVYRVHERGMWSGADVDQKIQYKLAFCRLIKSSLPSHVSRKIHMTYVDYRAADDYLNIGFLPQARRLIIKAILNYFRDPSVSPRLMLRVLLKTILPA